ncbi:MAG: coenzyme F420-0:L-glutamate ligase, partial [bacterium]|nr:coenzyme F420-0:L-glutamate ligase [bacterium]
MNIELSEDGLHFRPLVGIGTIESGDDLAGVLSKAATDSGIRLERGILVLCQKIVSKAEGRIVDLRDVTPGQQAL